VDARSEDGLVDLGVDEETRPVLLAVSDIHTDWCRHPGATA